MHREREATERKHRSTLLDIHIMQQVLQLLQVQPRLPGGSRWHGTRTARGRTFYGLASPMVQETVSRSIFLIVVRSLPFEGTHLPLFSRGELAGRCSLPGKTQELHWVGLRSHCLCQGHCFLLVFSTTCLRWAALACQWHLQDALPALRMTCGGSHPRDKFVLVR